MLASRRRPGQDQGRPASGAFAPAGEGAQAAAHAGAGACQPMFGPDKRQQPLTFAAREERGEDTTRRFCILRGPARNVLFWETRLDVVLYRI